ncbi:MAG: inner nuclear membrane protein enriched at telomere/subtelomere region, partial [Watsoniomyces obsoletus]
LAAGGAGYMRLRIIAHKAATAQIPNLVATTLDRLATQAALKEDGRVSEGFIGAGQLRDDVLRD